MGFNSPDTLLFRWFGIGERECGYCPRHRRLLYWVHQHMYMTTLYEQRSQEERRSKEGMTLCATAVTHLKDRCVANRASGEGIPQAVSTASAIAFAVNQSSVWA